MVSVKHIKLNIVVLRVIMLSVIMLTHIIQSVIMLSHVSLNVIMLSVVIPSVREPFFVFTVSSLILSLPETCPIKPPFKAAINTEVY
jgi:hypothetical protein